MTSLVWGRIDRSHLAARWPGRSAHGVPPCAVGRTILAATRIRPDDPGRDSYQAGRSWPRLLSGRTICGRATVEAGRSWPRRIRSDDLCRATDEAGRSVPRHGRGRATLEGHRFGFGFGFGLGLVHSAHVQRADDEPRNAPMTDGHHPYDTPERPRQAPLGDAHRRARPGASTGDAQGHRLHRRGPGQTDRRRGHDLDRNDAMQLQPASTGGVGQGRHPRARAARPWSSTPSQSATA